MDVGETGVELGELCVKGLADGIDVGESGFDVGFSGLEVGDALTGELVGAWIGGVIDGIVVGFDPLVSEGRVDGVDVGRTVDCSSGSLVGMDGVGLNV